MKAGAKSSLFLHPLYLGRYIDTNDWDSINNYINRNTTLPPLASHMFPCLGPNQPISALSCDSSANANHDHAVPFRFIVSPAHHPCFLELTCPFPNLFLDVIRAGCKPTPRRSRRRPYLCSGWAYYCADQWGLIIFGCRTTRGFNWVYSRTQLANPPVTYLYSWGLNSQ